MRKFMTYLKDNGYRLSTIDSYLKRIQKYHKWIAANEYSIRKMRYTDILQYVNYLKQCGNGITTINGELRVIRLYYNFLDVKHNPVNDIHIKGSPKRVPYAVLEGEQIDQLYKEFKTEKPHHKRDKVLLGLICYQGLNTSDLLQLTVQSVNLEQGIITIEKRPQSNARKLILQPNQIMDLHHYLNDLRPKLQNQASTRTDKLFFNKGQTGVEGILQRLAKRLSAQNKDLKSLKQIRSSVIINWLKDHNLRQVQYMAGHRYVSSTERYLQADLKGLREELNLKHPMG